MAAMTIDSRSGTGPSGVGALPGAGSPAGPRAAAPTALEVGRPPTHSSTIRCALLPPKPKLLIAARRGPPVSHASGSSRRRKPCSPIASSGSSHGVGRKSPASNEPSTLRRLATPDAVIGWPMLAFSDPITGLGPSPHAVARLSSSTRSPRGVPVAWHSTYETSAGRRPACAYAERIARTCPSVDGARKPA